MSDTDSYVFSKTRQRQSLGHSANEDQKKKKIKNKKYLKSEKKKAYIDFQKPGYTAIQSRDGLTGM